MIDWLRTQSAKLTENKTPVNFVWMVPAELKLVPVTLTLRQVPLLDVVRYSIQSSGLKYRIEPHAIVIYQPAAEPAKSIKAVEADVRPE